MKTVLLLVVHVPTRLGSMGRVVCDEDASFVLDWAAARARRASPNVIVSFICGCFPRGFCWDLFSVVGDGVLSGE